MTTPTPNVVHMETAARLIREAKEAREKRKAARDAPVNMPFERLPEHAHDPGFGPVPPRRDGPDCIEPAFPGGIDDLEV